MIFPRSAKKRGRERIKNRESGDFLEKGVNRNGQGRKKRDPEHFDQIMGERRTRKEKQTPRGRGSRKKKNISDPKEPVSRKYRILVDLFKSMQACELKKRLATHTSSSPGPPRSSIEANTTQPRPSPVAYKEPGGATTGLAAVTACMGTQMMGTRDRDPTGRVVAFGAGGGARFGLLGLSGRPN